MKKLSLLAAILVMLGVALSRQGDEPTTLGSLIPISAPEGVESDDPPALLKAQEEAEKRIARAELNESSALEPAETPKASDAGTPATEPVEEDTDRLWVDVTVIDSLGHPIAGANLVLKAGDAFSPAALARRVTSSNRPKNVGDLMSSLTSRGGPTTTTDDSGKAWMLVERKGLLRITARAEGYALTASEMIRLTETRPHASVEITLTAGGSVAGQLRDINGEPANAISLSIHLSAWPGQVGRGTTSVLQRVSTDESGSFLFTQLAPGEYNLYTRAKGKDLERVPAQTLKLQVIDGETTHVKFADLAQSYVKLSGRVFCNDQPVPFARLYIRWADNTRGHLNKNTKANKAGEFQITLDEGGEYRFLISSDDLEGSVLQVISIPSEPAHQIDIRFSTGEISGHVVDAGGNPAPNFSLIAIGRSEAGAGVAYATTDESGEYHLSDLVAGTYSIRSTNSMPAPMPEPSVERPYLGNAMIKDLDLRPGESLVDVDLQLSSAAAIDVSVRDNDGNLVEGAEVQFRGSGRESAGMPSTGRTDAQGAYLRGGLPGGNFLVVATLGQQASQAIPVEAQVNTTATVELVLEEGAIISCTALLKGEPGNTCVARVLNSNGLVVAMGFSREGQIEIGPIAPGTYTISGMSTIDGKLFKDEQALVITGSAPVSIQLNMK